MEVPMHSSLLMLPLAAIALFSVSASSETSLTVLSREEALNEENISKPRIIVENTGTEPVEGFSFRYYFTTENGREPVLDAYYVPNAEVTLEYFGSGRYAVRYDVPDVTLFPGEVYPDESGTVVGIHYQGWEPFCKNNDRSCNFSGNLLPNEEIPVLDSDGFVLNGSARGVVCMHRTRCAARCVARPRTASAGIRVRQIIR